MSNTFSISELADLGGVNRRTVRYYVQRGLIPPPTGIGRGKHYTAAHLDALVRVKRLQQEGATLDAIAHGKRDSELVPSSPRSPLIANLSPAPFSQRGWQRIEIADGVELHVQDRRNLDRASLARSVAALRVALTSPSGAPQPDPPP